MRVAIGSDHAGFSLKENLVAYLRQQGFECFDLGTDTTASVDYPDYAEKVGLAISEGRAERGILICGSGVGTVVAANKLPGVRAGNCHDTYSAHQGVEHVDMNVLVLGGRVVSSELAREIVRSFLGAHFMSEDRHRRRLEKVRELEERYRTRAHRPTSVGRRPRKKRDD